MPWRSGRTWSPTTVSAAPTTPSSVSFANCADSKQPEAVGIILTGPGEEAQVDYGTGPMVRDPQTGKYRRTRLFVMTLGYSRKAVRLLVFRSSTRTWAELHETAFRRLGGSCRVVVLDNLQEGVLTPDIYDPTLNPLFKDVLAHYGVVAMPCRVRDPDRKGKVESGVGHAQKTPLKGHTLRKSGRSAGLSGSVGIALGRHAHSRHDETASCGDVCRRKTVSCFHCRSNRSVITNTANASCIWTVASKWKRPITACRQAGSESSSRCNGMRFTSAFSIRKRISFCASMSASNAAGIASVRKTIRRKRRSRTTQLLARAARAGSHIGTFCEAIHHHQGEPGIRRILGVLSLAKKFGVSADRGCLRCRTRTARLRVPLRPPLSGAPAHN